MRSWVFRHRARLRVIYGLPRPSAEADRPLLPALAEAAAPEEAEPAIPVRKPKKVRRSGLEPGQVVRKGRYVVLAPMEPPGF